MLEIQQEEEKRGRIPENTKQMVNHVHSIVCQDLPGLLQDAIKAYNRKPNLMGRKTVLTKVSFKLRHEENKLSRQSCRCIKRHR